MLSVSSEGSVSRAVLLTEYLDGYVSLDRIIETRVMRGAPDRGTFLDILCRTAKIIRRVHDCGYRYGCMYPKHVFVKVAAGGISVRLIDLENSRYRPLGRGRVVKDLETFYRHGGWRVSRTDIMRFLLAYTGEARPGAKLRQICQWVGARHEKKRNRVSTAR
jgi:hypothetical protein